MNGELQIVEAISQLGVVGMLIVGIGLLLTRRLITMGEKKDSDAVNEARLNEKDIELTAYKELVKGLTHRLDRFQSVLERLTGVQVPSDPDVR